MKYLVIDNNEKQIDGHLYDIADFFWNNGNQVFISNNYNDANEYQYFVKSCDWIVMVKYEESTDMTFFESIQKKLLADFNLENNSKKLMLVFSPDGVFSNMIPFPHKIFHFESLGQNEIQRFFSWCKNLNLFMPK